MSSNAKESSTELEIRGLAASPGIAIGTVLRIDDQGGHKARMLHIPPTQVPKEVRRLQRALRTARKQLHELKVRMERELGTEHAYILDAHILMLQDRSLFSSIEHTIAQQYVNAEWAVKIELDRFLTAYASISDRYLRQRGSDIEDVGRRLMDALEGRRDSGFTQRISPGTVIVAEDIPPSILAELKIEQIVGMVTCSGGWASHTAIIARSLRIPAIVGIEQGGTDLHTGQTIILDGSEGLIILNPTETTLSRYQTLNNQRQRNFRELLKQSHGPALTQDGQEIILRANVELVSELDAVKRFGAQGIGLFRSEFIFTNMLPQAHSEEGQYQIYSQLVHKIGPDEAAIRVFDLNEDKISTIRGEAESNPALGLRGIRLALKNETLFRTQIRAIIRASGKRNVSIILPLITCINELRQARKIVQEIITEFTAQGLVIDPNIPLGVMIEVPSAVMMLPQIAQEADFLSLGTNDLIQYLLAVDRDNKAVAYLYQPLHPAVLNCLAQVAQVAQRLNKPLNVCGEMAANPLYAVVLLGLGITNLSMTPTAIPLIKDAIRAINLAKVKEIVTQALALSTAHEIEELLCDALAEHFPAYFANLKWGNPANKY